MSRIDAVRQAVERLHNCSASHTASLPVKEVFQGQTVWNGYVEVFDIIRHPKAIRCYAWAYETDDGAVRYQAVLELPPVDSPETAVRAAIMSDHRGMHGNKKGR